MIEVTAAEAQVRLAELLSVAETGQVVAIRGDNGRVFQISARERGRSINASWPGYPHPGSCEGLFIVPDDFKQPLDELREYME